MKKFHLPTGEFALLHDQDYERVAAVGGWTKQDMHGYVRVVHATKPPQARAGKIDYSIYIVSYSGWGSAIPSALNL